MTARVLERTGTAVRDQGAMYKVVAQSLILYGSKIWVVNGEMLKVLPGFHHQAARRITGMTEKRFRGGDGSRGDPPHRVVHQEVEDNHKGEGGLPYYLCKVHR